MNEIYDPDFRKLSEALRAFGIKAAQADVAVVYYAGHGVQVGRENFLLPADAQIERERDLVYEALSLELFLGEVSQARRLGIILLDAQGRFGIAHNTPRVAWAYKTVKKQEAGIERGVP